MKKLLNTVEASKLASLEIDSLYRLEKSGLFPTRVKYRRNGLLCFGWFEDEVEHWNNLMRGVSIVELLS